MKATDPFHTILLGFQRTESKAERYAMKLKGWSCHFEWQGMWWMFSCNDMMQRFGTKINMAQFFESFHTMNDDKAESDVYPLLVAYLRPIERELKIDSILDA